MFQRLSMTEDARPVCGDEESIADSKKKLETEKAELQEMKTQTEAKQDSVQLLLNEK